MTDDQLIQLLLESPPEELSLEQLELLRRRARESPELRAALVGQLQLDEALSAKFSRHQVMVEAIVGTQPVTGRAGRRFGLLAVGLLIAALGAGIMFEVNRQRHVANEPSLAAVAKTDPQTVPDAPPVATPQMADLPPESKTAKATPPAPVDPWSTPTDPPRRSFAETCFEQLARPAAADLAALRQAWMVEGKGKIDEVKRRDTLTGLSLSGTFRSKFAWPVGHVLKLALVDGESLALHLWRGREGVSFEYSERPLPAWAAYHSRRTDDGWDPDRQLLTGGDDDRSRRTGFGTVELRWQDGLAVLSRGDILLSAVPFDGQPETVVLEARRPLVLAGQSIYPGERFPLAESNLTEVPKLEPAASLDWKSELDEGAKFDLLPTQAVALSVTAKHGRKPSWASAAIELSSMRDVVLRLDKADAGTGLALFDDSGRPQTGIVLQELKGSDELVWAYGTAWDKRASASRQEKQRALPLAARPQWVRLSVGGGALKVWLSVDGRAWGRALDPRPLGGKFSRLGLFLTLGKEARRIELAGWTTIANPAQQSLAALAGPEVPAEVVTRLQAVVDAGAWLPLVLEAQPAGVSAGVWRRACAVATLAAPTRTEVARALVRDMVDDLADSDLPFDVQLKALSGLSRLADGTDAALTLRIARAYFDLGLAQAQRGAMHPFESIRRAYLEASLGANVPLPLPDRLVQAELLSLVYRDAWDDVRNTARQVRFFWPVEEGRGDNRGGQWPQTMQLADWADALAERNRPDPHATEPRSISVAWRHPLVEQLAKEGYNTLAEFEAAVNGEAYKDACKIVTSLTPRQIAGLLPLQHDPALLVSLPRAIALALEDRPALLRTMQEEFAPVGQLRLRQSIDAADSNAVQALTAQFPGTAPAADAWLWLGDRSLAEGDFLRAGAAYRAAAALAPDGHRQRAESRLRLAAAWQGQDHGQPPTEPVELGEATLEPEAFERLVADVRSHAQPASFSPDVSLRADLPPRQYALERRGTVDLTTLRDLAGMCRRDWDPLTAGLSATVAGGQLIVNARGDVQAFDWASGRPAWRVPLGGEAGKTLLWPRARMQPVVAGKRVYVRRLLAAGVELAALEAGQLRWRSPKGQIVASDPILLGERVLAATFAPAQQELLQLSLTSYEPTTGKVLAEKPLAQFRDLSPNRDQFAREPGVSLTVIDDLLIVVGGGIVLGCDLEGEPQWLRRETWIAGVVDQRQSQQRQSPTLSAGGKLYVTQPGVPAVACFETATGRLLWQQPESELVRLVALSSGTLIAQATNGFLAFDAISGKRLWQRPVEQLVDAVTCDAAGRLIYGQRRWSIAKPSQVWLVWIDARSGRELASAPVVQWRAEQPALGLLVEHDGVVQAFMSDDVRKPSRELVRLTPSGDATPSDPATLELAAWGASAGETAADRAGYFAGWQLLANLPDKETGPRWVASREAEVYVTSAARERPARWARHVALAADRPHRLRLRVTATNGGPWQLVVRTGSQTLLERTINVGKPEEPETVEVDLKELAGRETWLMVEQHAPTGRLYAAWHEMSLVEEER